MRLQVASGIISHLRVVSNTHGNGGSIQTFHTTTFRIGASLVEMRGNIIVKDGDEVVVVGPATGAGIRGVAIRDLKAGLLFTTPVNNWFLFAGIGFLLAAVFTYFLTVISSGPLSLGLIPVLIGGALVLFHKRETQALVEALVLLQTAASLPSQEPPAIAAILPTLIGPLQTAAWLFKAVAILVGLALTLETIAALYLVEADLSLLFWEMSEGAVIIATFWFASTWTFRMVTLARCEFPDGQPVTSV